jgi:signal transduction histidine kinase
VKVRRSIIVFGAGVLGVLAALGWMTVHALRLERAEMHARREARYQESMRLALWRMDAAVTPLIAREAARPYFHYQPFYSQSRAYARMMSEAQPGEAVVASPLLHASERGVRLYFQRTPGGRMTSPQWVGEGASLLGGAYTTAYDQAVMGERLRQLQLLLAESEAAAESVLPPVGMGREVELPGVVEPNLAEYSLRQSAVTSAQKVASPARAPASEGEAARRQESRESDGRGHEADAASEDRAEFASSLDGGLLAIHAPAAGEGDEVILGPFVPRWIPVKDSDPELIFEREVRLGGERVLQGFWIDWPVLRGELLASVRDLFPHAELRPLVGGVERASPDVLGRTLAAIPAELVALPAESGDVPLVTPVRTTLGLTWAVALAAIVVLALVMRASIELADRRGQFVSAVTHELRTPLTTFVMYSQMLADGLVEGEEAQRSYLTTLKNESTRLARIVESVLEYARLSRSQHSPGVRARLQADHLVEQIAPVLQERCERAGMELVVERESLLDFPLTTDQPTVERILYNLVDNACKYAAEAADKRVHLVASLDRRYLLLAVRDHGPGIPGHERSHIFRPFARGQKQQDGRIPGLGLGLALAQGLARELGGDLTLGNVEKGTEFQLRLPRD